MDFLIGRFQSPYTHNATLHPSASELTTLWHYTNLFIIIIIFSLMPNGVKCQRAKTEAKTHVGMARGPANINIIIIIITKFQQNRTVIGRIIVITIC